MSLKKFIMKNWLMHLSSDAITWGVMAMFANEAGAGPSRWRTCKNIHHSSLILFVATETRSDDWLSRSHAHTHPPLAPRIYQRTPPWWIKSGLFSSFALRSWGSMCDEARALSPAAAERRRWINQYCPCVSLRYSNDAHQRAN